MKKSALIVLTLLTPALLAETVDCKSQTYFSENSCTICQTSGDATVEDNTIILTEAEISWENKSTEMNQNFYQENQKDISILTNIATAPTKDLEDIVQWWADMVWKNIDGVKFFSLATEQTIILRSVEDETEIPVTDIKTVAAPHLVVKIPVTYSEVKNGSFNESAPKTTNYCVSYTPKITSTGTAATPTPVTTTPPPAVSTPPATSTAPAPSTPTPKTSTAASDIISDTPEEDTPVDEAEAEEDTSATEIDDEIPTYNAKVTLNSAGSSPSLWTATKVKTGPEEMVVLLIACLLAALLYPKVNKVFQKN